MPSGQHQPPASGALADGVRCTPFFSVVVPSYNRPTSLARCLEALCVQTLPSGQFEVIVCDDGSPEPLAPELAPFTDPLQLTVVTQPNAGPAAARNRGASHARGRVLAFIDDDCVPAPGWLAQLADCFSEQQEELVGGAIENILPDDPYATATQLIMLYVNEYYQRVAPTRSFYTTSNLAVPLDRFRELGGFSETFPYAAGEDYDFCARWYEAGFSSRYAPDAVVGHAHGHNLRTFWRQHFTYGRALLRVRQRMARRAGRRGVTIEKPHFYSAMLVYPLRQPGPHHWLHAALVLLSQIATAAGAGRELVFGRHGMTEEHRLAHPA